MDGRDSYERQELLQFAENFFEEVKLWYQKDKKSSLVGVASGFFIGLVFSVMGGIYGFYYESYLFLSASGTALLYFFLPQLKESLHSTSAGLGKMFDYEIPFFVSFNLVVLAQMLSAYIVFHSLNFFFVFLNILLIIGLTLHHLYRFEEEKLQLNEPEDLADY